MAHRLRYPSPVISLVLALVFGFLAIILTYAAFSSGSAELRSRAAQEQVIRKQWEFTTDTEGWEVEKGLWPLRINQKSGLLIAVVDRTIELPTIRHTQVDTTLPAGQKSLKLQLAVKPAVKSSAEAAADKVPIRVTPTPTPRVEPFMFNIYLRLAGKKGFEPPLILRGVADGRMKEYEVPLTGLYALRATRIEQMRIEFTSLKGKPLSEVDIDWMRLIWYKKGAVVEHPVTWKTPYAKLEASDFSITVNGEKFYGEPDPGTPMRIDSDPPDPPSTDYTTLEVEWMERGLPMRLYIYFYKGDGKWWTKEIRTYDGKKWGEADWIYYETFLSQSLGSPYQAKSLNLTGLSYQGTKGEIQMKNVSLWAFTNIVPTKSPIPIPTSTVITTLPPKRQ